jgi:hypothetical protein
LGVADFFGEEAVLQKEETPNQIFNSSYTLKAGPDGAQVGSIGIQDVRYNFEDELREFCKKLPKINLHTVHNSFVSQTERKKLAKLRRKTIDSFWKERLHDPTMTSDKRAELLHPSLPAWKN